MKRLNKGQLLEISVAVDACAEACGEVEAAVEAYNKALEAPREALLSAVAGYNEKIEDLKAMYLDLAQQGRDYFDDRSEKWQEGDAGQAYNEWLEQLENPEIESVEIDLPDELERPNDLLNFDEIDWLPPDEPGEI